MRSAFGVRALGLSLGPDYDEVSVDFPIRQGPRIGFKMKRFTSEKVKKVL
jgi:hypothetical protein